MLVQGPYFRVPVDMNLSSIKFYGSSGNSASNGSFSRGNVDMNLSSIKFYGSSGNSASNGSFSRAYTGSSSSCLMV